MKYNTQTDSRWANDVMTMKEGKWIDRIGRWGCLVTSLANIMQEHSNIDYTPKYLNELLKNHNGYYYPQISIKEETASFLNWEVIKKLLNFDNIYAKNYDEKNYLIARIPTKFGGHYINVIKKINDRILCFDVMSGDLELKKIDEITFYWKIKFLEG